MPRKENSVEVDVDTTADGSAETTAKEPKAKKEPARGTLPDNFVTPVGLAKILGEQGLQTNRAGDVLAEVKPQMVYSYIKNAPENDPFPLENVTDSLGKERKAVDVEKGVAWWVRKNERAASRKANAAEKAAKKAEKAAEADEESEAGE